MTLRLSTLVGFVGLALVAGGVSCSSDDDDAPPAHQGGSSGVGTGGNSGTGGTDSGFAGDDSGGTSSAICPPPGAAGASDVGASGQTGTAGEAGASSEAPSYVPPGDCTAGVAATPWLHTYGNEIMDVNGNPVILRGVAMIDLGATEQWEGGVNAMIDRLTSDDDPQSYSPGWATRAVRLVVSPSEDVLEQLSPDPYVPDSDYYERLLRPAVDHAREKGLYAIVDWHYTDGTDAHVKSTDDFWAEMAPHFAHDSNVLFELYNEPTDGGTWFTVKENMQRWYDTVRKYAPDNLVLVGTANFDQLPADAAMDPLEGTNIAYVAHMYPQDYAQEFLRDQIVQAKALVPVFMTEWGFHEDPNADRTNGTIASYGKPIKAFIEEQRLSWTACCASATMAPPLFNDDYTLRTGKGEMGGFVKDWLWERRADDQPAP